MASELHGTLERIAARLADAHGDLVGAARTDATSRQRLEQLALAAVVRELRVRRQEARRLAVGVVREIAGFGPLEDLLDDPRVSEIMVNGHRQVFVERDGRLEESEVRFRDEAHLLHVIRRMVRNLGRRLDRASPTVDGRLPDGSRFHAIIPPLVLQGVVLTIRKFPRRRWNAADLCQRGTWDNRTKQLLVAAVQARLNILIAGATGAGKTTTLAALVNSGVPAHERVITIEEAAELRLDHAHLIAMEARPGNTEGRGTVTIRQLLRNALRMRPDRLIIGEVRGEEAFELLQALNTGHRGSLSTVHANGTLDALHRFENMALMAPERLPHRVLRQQVAQAVDLVMHLRRAAGGKRWLTELAAVGLSSGERTWRLRPLVRREGARLVHQEAALPERFRGQLVGLGEAPQEASPPGSGSPAGDGR